MSQSTKRRWNSGPSTPSSTSKKKKYNCKFQDEWKKSHHWIQSSSLGNDLAICTLCSSNFSVASGGLYDIKRHSETSLHKKAVTATNKTLALINKLNFRVLSKLAKACCVIPVSNADPERIFSMLKKIQTDMRSDLNKDTICCLICAKQNQDKACFEFNPSDSAAKKAVLTYQSNISSCN